jgi:thioredoxin reductase
MAKVYDVIIIGSGPSGYTAAIYAARANLAVLMFQGYETGGQLTQTTDVENYPGFEEGILGPEMMEKFEAQARRFGTEMLTEDVTAVDFSKRPFTLTADSGEYQDRAFKNPKISFIWDSEVAEVLGDEEVNGLRLRNLKTHEESTLPVQGLFLAIGHKPNTDLFKGVIDTDKAGYIVPSELTTTNIPGVFAAGDVTDHRYRQAVTAAGDGCRAAIDVERWLEAQAEAERSTEGNEAGKKALEDEPNEKQREANLDGRKNGGVYAPFGSSTVSLA